MCVYRKLGTGVVAMETAKDRGRFDAPGPLNRGERPAHLYPMIDAF
jgi:hypothetical protein